MHAPLGINQQMKTNQPTLDSTGAGGKVEYSFLTLTFLGFFVWTFLTLNLGKNLSHDSLFRAGSLASSLFIINVFGNKKFSLRFWVQTFKRH